MFLPRTIIYLGNQYSHSQFCIICNYLYLQNETESKPMISLIQIIRSITLMVTWAGDLNDQTGTISIACITEYILRVIGLLCNCISSIHTTDYNTVFMDIRPYAYWNVLVITCKITIMGIVIGCCQCLVTNVVKRPFHFIWIAIIREKHGKQYKHCSHAAILICVVFLSKAKPTLVIGFYFSLIS